MVLKAHELEVQHIQFGKLEDNSLVQSQKLAFISYKEPKARLVVQTPEFLTETYGIPREGPFYSTPKSRAFFKLPFCHERHMHEGEVDYAQIEHFYKKLQEIDKYCDTDEFRAHMFGEKFAKKYEYQPLIRTAEEEDPENPKDETKTYYRPPYTKVKLDLFHDTEKPNFRLFDKSSGQRQEVPLTSFNDVLQHMRFMSKHRMVIHFSKLYAMKTSSGSDKRKYGIVLKATAVECVNKALPKADRDADLFSD